MMRSIPLLCSLAFLVFAAPAQAQLLPQVAIAEMGRGINMGNTLEPPTESAWNNGPAEEHYFDDYRDAGFSTVRIPVRWDEHTADTAPFAIDESWMTRVEEVVDWALARDLYVIINAHHEDWLKQGYADPVLRDRFDAIWTQVADRFQDRSEKLLFEIINEPFGMTREEVDELNARIIPIMRANNPTRLIIFSGAEYSNAEQLIAAAIPDDDYLLAYYHSYDPWQFAGLGERGWGSEVDMAAVRAKFQSVADWSLANGIPVMISEFGAIRETDFNDRMPFYALYVEEALRHNIAFQVWDDGGMFEVYNRDTRTWNAEKDILVHGHPDSPTALAATLVGDTLVALSWTNRASGLTSFLVERRRPDGTFAQVAEVPPETTTYEDTGFEGGQTYQYRVIAHYGRGDDRYSYPIELFAPPTVRAPFLGAPHPIPGTLEAEDFDEGGEGLTYHDTEAQNIPGGYRPGTGVDIEARDDGGWHVAYIESGEWLEYTVDVATAGVYEITTYVASLDGGGRFRLAFGENKSPILVPPDTDSWQTLAPVTTTMTLEAGEQILRLELLTARPFNVDRMVFTFLNPTAVDPELPAPRFAVYPNPAAAYVDVRATHPGQTRRLAVYNVLGQRVRSLALTQSAHRLNLGDLPAGLYLLRLTVDGRFVGQERLIKR